MRAPSSPCTPRLSCAARTETDASSLGTRSLSPNRKPLRNRTIGPRAKSPRSPLPKGKAARPSPAQAPQLLSRHRRSLFHSLDRAHKSPGRVRSESQAPGMASQGNYSPRSLAKGIHSLEATRCRSLWQSPRDESIRRSHPASWPAIIGRFLPRKPGACTAA